MVFHTAGIILHHGFVLTGYWPWQLCVASVVEVLVGAPSPALRQQSLLDVLPECMAATTSQLLDPATFSAVPDEKRMELMRVLEAMSDINSAETFARELPSISHSLLYWKHLALWLQLRSGLVVASPTLWEGLCEEAIVGYRATLAPSPSKVVAALQFMFADAIPALRVCEERVKLYLEAFLWASTSTYLQKFLCFCTAVDVVLPPDVIKVEFDSTKGANRLPRAMTCSQTLTLSRCYVSQDEFNSDLFAVIKCASAFDSI